MVQMPPSQEILLKNRSSRVFHQFLSVAEEFCSYIRDAEGINAIAIHPHEREFLFAKFTSLPVQKQEKKLQRFIGFYEHCRELANQGRSLKEKKASLTAFMKKFGLSFPNEKEIFEILDQQTFIEIYDLDFIQCYRSIDFLNATTHSVMALESCEWWDLFDRSKLVNNQIMSAVESIYSGATKTPLFKPVEEHTVKEIRSQSPLSSQADILLYSPIYDQEGVFQGGLHFFKIRSVYKIDFKVLRYI